MAIFWLLNRDGKSILQPEILWSYFYQFGSIFHMEFCDKVFAMVDGSVYAYKQFIGNFFGGETVSY